MCKTKTKSGATGRLNMLPALVATAALLFSGGQAWAHQEPAGCSANNLVVNIARDKVNIVNGEVVTYTIHVENPTTATTCDVSLGPDGLVFTCPGPDGTPSGTSTTLIPGGTLLPEGYAPPDFIIQCTVTLNPGVTVGLAKIAALDGILHDNPVGNGSPVNIDKTITVNVFSPCIEVTKQCDGAPFAYGQPIHFSGSVSNCGDIILHNVTVVDDHAGVVFGPADLAAGASANYSGQYDPSGDLCGPFTDIVTATGVASDLDIPVTVTDTATATCPVSTSPCIEVTKVCGPASIAFGDSYTVSGSVHNCGNVPLVNVVVVDTITDANGGVTTVSINIGTLDVGETKPVPPQTIAPTLCGPSRDQFTVSAENVCPQGPAVTPASSQTCTTTVVCPPCIQVTKGVACRPIAPADCNSLAVGAFQASATGVADSGNPAFCYRVTVSNCSDLVGLQNVTVTDTDENGATTIASGVSLAPGETKEYRYSKSWGVGTHADTVTAQGNSVIDDAQATAAPASATVTVLQINIECSVVLNSTFDMDNNLSDNHVTLPAGSVNTPVEVTLTLNNNGTADLIVTTVSGLPSLVDCADDTTPVDPATVLGLPLSIPAGGSVSTTLGCWLVSCPSDSFSATAHAEADSAGGTLCVYDENGELISDDSPACPADVTCVAPSSCRTTGGGTLYNGDTDQSCQTVTTTLFPLTSDGTANGKPLDHISHGGQLGAPYAVELCPATVADLGNPCIRGQWQHTRHYVGKGNPRDVIDMDFHSNTPKGVFDLHECACLGCCDPVTGAFIPGTVSENNLCNPDDHKICGPQPRPASANAIIFSGIGTIKPETDGNTPSNKEAEYVVFRVYIEDRSEPGGFHPKGAVEPADVYSFQAWKTGIKVTKKPDFTTVATGLRLAVAQQGCAFINSLAADQTGALIGTLPSSVVTVGGVDTPADINDQGALRDGNRQIHPSTSAPCTQ